VIASLLSPLLGPIVDRVLALIPDGNARAQAKEDLERSILDAANAAATAQTRINEIEAAHTSIFVAGWRPFIGWTCGAGIAWSFLVQPVAAWAVAIWAPHVVLPVLDTGPLFTLVMAMLGASGLRTYEKLKGVARITL